MITTLHYNTVHAFHYFDQEIKKSKLLNTVLLITRLKLASFVCVTRSSETQLPGMFCFEMFELRVVFQNIKRLTSMFQNPKNTHLKCLKAKQSRQTSC